MSKPGTKPYRLMSGTHSVPNPDYKAPSDVDATREGYGSDSHYIANVGDVVHLTDDQFKAFKHKFAPLGSAATDVRDADVAQLEEAKRRAARTGQNVDPNKLDVEAEAEDADDADKTTNPAVADPFKGARA